MDYLNVGVLFPSYMCDTRGLLKLGRFSGEYLALSSLWKRLSARLVVSGRMDLV